MKTGFIMGLFVASLLLNGALLTGKLMPVQSVAQYAESQEDRDFVTALIEGK